MLIIHKKILSVHLFMGVGPQALKNGDNKGHGNKTLHL